MPDITDGLAFGFDVGIDFVGFAAVDFDQQEVVHLASHRFNAPEVAKTRESAAAMRRQYRSQRRRIERTRVRKAHVRALLIEAGLVPSEADGHWFEVRGGDLKVVELRAAALDRAISPRDLARILYHFACSRQYIDQGLGAGGEVGGDDGKVLGALKANNEELQAVGARTWGELLYRKYFETGRSTNSAGDYSLCVSHELVRDEARVIVARQRELGGPDLPADLFDRYLDELSWLVPGYERTCCNVGGEEWGFKCSECGGHTHGSPFHVPDEEREELAEMLGGRIVSLHGSVPRFCPNCGAKVVDDHA